MRIFEPHQYVAVDFDRRTIRTVCKGPGRFSPEAPNIEIAEKDYQEGDPLEREIDAFLRSVASRRKPIVSGEEGAEALEAAILVNDSLRSHAAFVDKIDKSRRGLMERAEPTGP
jgi:predicted dehydrogenase